MKLVTTRADLRAARSGPAVFVPTMGALHAGHARLIERAAKDSAAHGWTGGCIVSIFVNPSQFNDPADFARYPKTLEADLDLCRAAGCSVVYAPAVEDIYPPDEEVPTPPLPEVATRPGLEDAHRPGHFAGVCRVVKRLFDLVRPAAAVFGEKDWQQLQVVRAMTRHHGLDIEIVGEPTVREADGLAMSSRNRFLSAEDRARALALSRALCAAAGEKQPPAAEAAMRRVLSEAGIIPEYAVVRDAATLGPPRGGWVCRALIAARVGDVRLIDNAAFVQRQSEAASALGL